MEFIEAKESFEKELCSCKSNDLVFKNVMQQNFIHCDSCKNHMIKCPLYPINHGYCTGFVKRMEINYHIAKYGSASKIPTPSSEQKRKEALLLQSPKTPQKKQRQTPLSTPNRNRPALFPEIVDETEVSSSALLRSSYHEISPLQQQLERDGSQSPLNVSLFPEFSSVGEVEVGSEKQQTTSPNSRTKMPPPPPHTPVLDRTRPPNVSVNNVSHNKTNHTGNSGSSSKTNKFNDNSSANTLRIHNPLFSSDDSLAVPVTPTKSLACTHSSSSAPSTPKRTTNSKQPHKSPLQHSQRDVSTTPDNISDIQYSTPPRVRRELDSDHADSNSSGSNDNRCENVSSSVSASGEQQSTPNGSNNTRNRHTMNNSCSSDNMSTVTPVVCPLLSSEDNIDKQQNKKPLSHSHASPLFQYLPRTKKQPQLPAGLTGNTNTSSSNIVTNKTVSTTPSYLPPSSPLFNTDYSYLRRYSSPIGVNRPAGFAMREIESVVQLCQDNKTARETTKELNSSKKRIT